MTNIEFIKTYYDDAKTVANDLGISALVPLAQWMLETGRGTSFLDRVYNNLAGIENPNQKPTIFEHFASIPQFLNTYVLVMKQDCPALAHASPIMSPLEVFAGSDWAGNGYADEVQGVWLHSIVPAYQEYIKSLVQSEPKTTPIPVNEPPAPPQMITDIPPKDIITLPVSSVALKELFKWDMTGAVQNPQTGIGNSEFYITFDSGSFELLIPETIATKLNLPNLGTQNLTGVGGPVISGMLSKVNVMLGSYILTDINCVCIPNFMGILFGSKTLVDRNIGVTLNPVKMTITFFDAS